MRIRRHEPMKFGKRTVRLATNRWRRVSDHATLCPSVSDLLRGARQKADRCEPEDGCLPTVCSQRCVVAAPAIGSESASEAVSWIVCSAGAANGVHGPCDRYQASRLALRASWSSRWLAAPNRLHCKSTLCSDAMLYSCTARSDGLSAHRSHPDFGAWHLASDCVCGVSRRGVQVNVPALVVLFRRNGGM